ncbi:hypothetical protein C8R43DRAFT_1121823 [Mycena crocata]|nr:hypothetical protein C8R43DRAFT_1121823 [Mycena crocata]
MNFSVLLLPVLLSSALASFIVNPINSDALSCEALLLQWQGGLVKRHGYWIVAVDGSVLEVLGTFETTSFRWTVDLPAGTAVGALVTDSTGSTAISQYFTIQPGSTSCTSTNVFAAPPDPAADVQPTTKSTTSSEPTSGSDSADSIPSEPTLSLSSASTDSATLPKQALTASTSTTISVVPSSTKSSPGQIPEATQATPNFTPTSTTPLSTSSPSIVSSSGSRKRTSHTGIIFAIVVPCLILLVISSLWVVRWRRRQRRSLSAIEAQWFASPAYSSSSNGNITVKKPQTLNIRPTSTVASGLPTLPPPQSPDPHSGTPSNHRIVVEASQALDVHAEGAMASGLTFPPIQSADPPSSTASDPTSNYVGALQYRITALMEANTVLANLAAPVDAPPPAYT